MKTEMALFAVTRLETFKHDQRAQVTSLTGTATGFFYRNAAGRLFLVTNKHVVYDKDKHYFPDRLRFYVHSDLEHLTKIKHIDLRLWSKDGQKLWKSVQYRPIDIATLEVPEDKLMGCRYLAFSKKDMFDADAERLLGKDIGLGWPALVLGYPLGFYDKNTLLPMAYAATVATWPWLDFEGKPCFLVDARLHPGMSGSPVISCAGTIRIKQDSPGTEDVEVSTESYLLGVLSDERTPEGEPIGLNTIWHANIIKEIVNDK